MGLQSFMKSCTEYLLSPLLKPLLPPYHDDLDFISSCSSLSETLQEEMSAMYYDPDTNLWMVTVRASGWAPGMWAGCEGLPILFTYKNVPNELYTIASIDLEKRLIGLRPHKIIAPQGSEEA